MLWLWRGSPACSVPLCVHWEHLAHIAIHLPFVTSVCSVSLGPAVAARWTSVQESWPQPPQPAAQCLLTTSLSLELASQAAAPQHHCLALTLAFPDLEELSHTNLTSNTGGNYYLAWGSRACKEAPSLTFSPEHPFNFKGSQSPQPTHWLPRAVRMGSVIISYQRFSQSNLQTQRSKKEMGGAGSQQISGGG